MWRHFAIRQVGGGVSGGKSQTGKSVCQLSVMVLQFIRQPKFNVHDNISIKTHTKLKITSANGVEIKRIA